MAYKAVIQHLPVLLFICFSAGARAQDSTKECVLSFRVDEHGSLKELGGLQELRISQRTFQEILHTGCKQTGPPTRVVLQASPLARYGSVLHWMEIKKQNALPSTQLVIQAPK